MNIPYSNHNLQPSYLGVTVDQNLRWSEHICNTVSNANGFLNRISVDTPVKLTKFVIYQC